jgi:tetratricopeptide (TPR) repeat protein
MNRRERRQTDKKRQGKSADSPPQLNATEPAGALLQVAVNYHNTGDLEKAETHYRKILETDPKNPNVLHLLGYLAHQLGFGKEGLSLIKEAISYEPETFLFHSNLAKVCLALRDVEQAEIAYRRCLELESGNLDIMNDLANLLRTKEKGPGTKSLQEAAELLGEVLVQKPIVPEYQMNFGNILRDNQQYEEAITYYEKVLDTDPKFTGAALRNIGVIYSIKGDYKLAKEYVNKALKINSKDTAALNNFAQILVSDNQLDQGIEYFERASELDPHNPLIYLNMGRALMRRRRDEEALGAFQKSMELDSSKVTPFTSFAGMLRMMDKLDESEMFVRSALEQFPEDPLLLTEQANNLQFNFEFEESDKLSRKILKLHPFCGPALVTLAIVLVHTGDEEEVLELYKKAFEMMPDEPTIPYNYALTMFCYGNLEEAWKHYRSRWEVERSASPVRAFPQDLWDGSSLEGKKIVLYGEQGLGDEIRHASMVPDMLKMGAEVHVECEPRLVDLFQRSFEGAKVFPCPYTDAENGNVDIDFQSPILDLGGFLRPTIDSFPSDPNHAFLKADPERIAFWGDRMEALGPSPKVGMIWQSTKAVGGRGRWGATVEELAPILSIAGIDFVNLMYTECSDDRAKMKKLYGVNLHTWDDIDLRNDQDDLCALISNLDLVVSHTSSVAYTAAGLGIPTFNFMPIKVYFDLLGDPEAPGWAPSLRYFRKYIHENWDGPLNEIAAEIRAKFDL